MAAVGAVAGLGRLLGLTFKTMNGEDKKKKGDGNWSYQYFQILYNCLDVLLRQI